MLNQNGHIMTMSKKTHIIMTNLKIWQHQIMWIGFLAQEVAGSDA